MAKGGELRFPRLLLATGALLGLALEPAPAGAKQGACFDEEAKLVAPDGDVNEYFGRAVAIDGDTVLVGAPSHDGAGAVYVFVRGGSAWALQAELVSSDLDPADAFGAAVDLDGDTALIGANGVDDNGDRSGAAYVFVRTGTSWTQQAKLTASDGDEYDDFGLEVSLDGDTALVGAWGWNPGIFDFEGEAYIFQRSGSSWTEQQILLPDDYGPTQFYACSVSLSGDTALVGAREDDAFGTASGAAYVFRRTAATWTQEQKLVPLDGVIHDQFGTAVAVEGDTALVGTAYGSDHGFGSGSAYVFTRSGTTWNQQVKLIPGDSTAGDAFGTSVALRGDTAVIGAYADDDHGSASGGAYVFVRSGGTWIETAKLLAVDGEPFDRFGAAVAVTDGRAVAGAYRHQDSEGAAYVDALPTEAGAAYCECPAGPCGNSDPGAGCANSTGHGARLTARGSTQPDEVSLIVTGARPGQLAIYFEGSSMVQIPFGDGFRCAGGSIVRITRPPVPIASDGSALYGPCFGDASISSVTGVVPGSGVTRRYQFWYRDPGGPCGGQFNLTNGYAITW